MTVPGHGGTIAATFVDKASAEACLKELQDDGFGTPWMAVVPEKAAGRPEHAIAESSDGPLAALGRYVTGQHSLRRSLAERGVAEETAERIDASLALGGAVIVVEAGERSQIAIEILRRSASRVLTPESDIGGRYPSTTDTVPGQGDELDRGSGAGASGGGLGATTGFMSESGARKDLHANATGELEEK